MKLYTTDFIRHLSRKHHRPQTYYRTALAQIVAELTEQVGRGHRVQITGFGSFYSRLQPASRIKDVRTDTLRTVPAHHVAAFHVGEVLRQAVRSRSSQRTQKSQKSQMTTSRGRPSKATAATKRATRNHALPRLARFFRGTPKSNA